MGNFAPSSAVSFGLGGEGGGGAGLSGVLGLGGGALGMDGVGGRGSSIWSFGSGLGAGLVMGFCTLDGFLVATSGTAGTDGSDLGLSGGEGCLGLDVLGGEGGDLEEDLVGGGGSGGPMKGLVVC